MLRTFSRYVLVQVFAYALDMGTFLLFSQLTGLPVPSNVAGKLVAGTFAFVAHRRVTFHEAGRAHASAFQQLWRYAALLALNIPLSSGLLVLFMRFIEWPTVAKVMADGVCILITFALSRYLVFTKVRDEGSSGHA